MEKSEIYEKYWDIKLEKVKKALEKNNFTVFIASDAEAAGALIMQEIVPQIENLKIASFGDSMTLRATGVLEAVKQLDGVEFIDPFPKGAPREEKVALRRRALLTDLFFTGSNALTEDGKLVNLDMDGNRIGGIACGPRNVILTIGRNKIVPDVERAMARIKEVAAPLNAIRHDSMKTPCQKTGECMDCRSPDRICNQWLITEKCYPPGRIRVVLINGEAGL